MFEAEKKIYSWNTPGNMTKLYWRYKWNDEWRWVTLTLKVVRLFFGKVLNCYCVLHVFIIFLYFRFQVLLKVMMLSTTNAALVTYTCCILHNLISQERPKPWLHEVMPQPHPAYPDHFWQNARTLDGLQHFAGNTGLLTLPGCARPSQRLVQQWFW